MSIGGIDIVLLAPAKECVGDLILRVCCRHWNGRKCQFQDANDTNIRPLDDPWVWQVGTASKEFFVFRDPAAAESWGKEGAIPANANTMFHFIIGEPKADPPSTVEVGFVCDKLTTSVKDLLAELKAAFLAVIGGAKEYIAA